ncbi:BREX-1 system adenine-specific DNA-methyltransferase PglX [Filibacter tadaridae]|uniref:site-specific DNA-methyltransferase (adenine-specific) n=1 Tax=Filibacter tadaridae TaxID=2483811 RepID=A0A3P5WL28_9BACL|nr:BREX-1 system adenine-specific DNA-methyltransferase PglX [Filibacter tadaridae]VDC19305.1 N-6 DNA Methylase [Filibacter tadaridae]
MNKTAIKNFAVTARRKLIADITQKAYQLGITQEEIKQPELFEEGFRINQQLYKKYEIEQRQKLIDEISGKGFDHVIEEVAYTWFNRFIAIRFMEVNDYLPTGIRVFSSLIEGKTEPDIVTEVNLVVDELNLDQPIVYRLQDEGDTADLFKYVLIRQCNKLGKIMPGMFEKIHDYTELLLPDQLLVDGSVVRDMVTMIGEADWKQQVEIIGWLYQYYISEKKDEVFAGLKKNQKITKENIPAATQLFTPKWIVQYMVENSLGRLWLESHPDDVLQQQWAYYLEEAVQEPAVQAELETLKNPNLKPEDITVLDPCMGSGHILVYAFDVLHEIYVSAGYAKRDIPKLILENNLYGLDIDDRASQLSYFALLMKACSYTPRILDETLIMNVCAIQQSNTINKDDAKNVIEQSDFEGDKESLQQDVEYILDVFYDAKEFGSILDVAIVNFEQLDEWLKYLQNEAFNDLFLDQYKENLLEEFPPFLQQAKIMSSKYDVVVTNPPYMAADGFNATLDNELTKRFPDSRTNLYSVFMEKIKSFNINAGYNAIITQHSWMYITSFKKLRTKLIDNQTIYNMVHLGTKAFEEINGEKVETTSYVLRNIQSGFYCGAYVRLVDYKNFRQKESEFFNKDNKYFYVQKEFNSVKGSPISYTMTKIIREIFLGNDNIGSVSYPKKGMFTGGNKKFIRQWYEIDINYFSDSISDLSNAFMSKLRYFPLNKGGEFRKWYGNRENVIKFDKENYELIDKNGGHRSPQFYFKKSLSWSKVTKKSLSFRFTPHGAINNDAGMAIYQKELDITMLIGLLNTKVIQKVISYYSDTMNYTQGDIVKIPFIDYGGNGVVIQVIEKCIAISKEDWDSFDLSWDFKRHPLLVRFKGERTIESAFRAWEREAEYRFNILKSNEEQLNEIFIKLYGLEDELTPEVEDADVTVRKADLPREVKSFISYAVGCMFGRYSLDQEGLVFAGGEFEPSKYTTFVADVDNVIPITDNQYFEDDIAGRFFEFVRITFSEETFEKNLDFIAEALIKRATETSRQRIRRYFLNEFYKDHVKMYQKCPIYWQFDSGKNDGFKALVYMHRYEPGLAARVRTDYLHVLQKKYEAEMVRLDMMLEEEVSVTDKANAKKWKEKLQKQLLECRQYDQVIAHIAYQNIDIDLDDGVKVNYAKFQQVEVPQGEGRKSEVVNVLKEI